MKLGSSQQEWVELFNRSSKSISLSGWVLRSATDGKPYLNLTGTTTAGGYYLIERSDDNTVSNIAADFIAPFGSGTGVGLVDTGEVLVLERVASATSTIDQTPALGTCGANQWCGGNTSERKTMERVDADLAGTDSASWGTNDGTVKNGSSTDAIALNGTPKARNSRNYYISQTSQLASSKTLAKTRSPYVVDANGLAVNSGVTLTIEPGVVVKFYTGTPDLTVNGTLKAMGSVSENIVFTSFRDDEFGGDLNGDGSAGSPAAGDWRSVIFNSSSQSSELSHVRVRYGGKFLTGQTVGQTLVDIQTSSPEISNSTFEKSFRHGLRLVNSTSTVSNSTIRLNNNDSLSEGIHIEGGSPTVQSNTFRENTLGLSIALGSSATVSGNTFASSTNEAIRWSAGSTPSFSGNTATATNGINGIVVTGSLNSNYTFPKDLPYVFEATLTLSSGKTFTIPAGIIFKGKNNSAQIVVAGAVTIQGSAAEPVVFTSLKDDTYGGDTNNDGSAGSPQAGDWLVLGFTSTATSSSISNAVIRYGGGFPSTGFAGLKLDSVGINVTNSVIEKNRSRGIWMVNATSTMSGLTIRDHTEPSAGTSIGLELESGSRLVLSNSTFRNNMIGISKSNDSTFSNGGGNDVDNSNTTKTIPQGLLP